MTMTIEEIAEAFVEWLQKKNRVPTQWVLERWLFKKYTKTISPKARRKIYRRTLFLCRQADILGRPRVELPKADFNGRKVWFDAIGSTRRALKKAGYKESAGELMSRLATNKMDAEKVLLLCKEYAEVY